MGLGQVGEIQIKNENKLLESGISVGCGNISLVTYCIKGRHKVALSNIEPILFHHTFKYHL